MDWRNLTIRFTNATYVTYSTYRHLVNGKAQFGPWPRRRRATIGSQDITWLVPRVLSEELRPFFWEFYISITESSKLKKWFNISQPHFVHNNNNNICFWVWNTSQRRLRHTDCLIALDCGMASLVGGADDRLLSLLQLLEARLTNGTTRGRGEARGLTCVFCTHLQPASAHRRSL